MAVRLRVGADVELRKGRAALVERALACKLHPPHTSPRLSRVSHRQDPIQVPPLLRNHSSVLNL
eukprot:12023957-Heterocapsa_arctica.AAC.1